MQGCNEPARHIGEDTREQAVDAGNHLPHLGSHLLLREGPLTRRDNLGLGCFLLNLRNLLLRLSNELAVSRLLSRTRSGLIVKLDALR